MSSAEKIEEYEKILLETTKEFPDFKIIHKKDSRLMKLINVALQLITFGKMKSFMTDFITTLGTKIYVNEKWDSLSPLGKAIVIRHERVHMRQAKKYGRLLFSILYLVVPFPIGIAYFRKKFEQEAYEESIRAAHEYYGDRIFTNEMREKTISHFTTAEYFWMWPWKKDLNRWYSSIIKKVI
jgi:hypothetical protein